ncbi:MAG: phytanoyl-CoA dioxygenase family protein [Rhodospirillales bacterium]
MPALTAEEVTRYQQDGIVIPKVGLDATTVAELRTKLDSFLAEQKITDADYVPDIIERDPSWLRYGVMPEILDAVAQLIGEDIIIWGSALFCKAGKGGKATPWHQDGQYWPIRPLATCTVWIALDPSNVANGCLRLIPGSHRDRTLLPHMTEARSDVVLTQRADDAGFDASTAVDIELEPGQMSLHDVYAIHGSNPNRSPQRRAGVAIRYMPATSLFARDLIKTSAASGYKVDFSTRPIWLVAGQDRTGQNDFRVGHKN